MADLEKKSMEQLTVLTAGDIIITTNTPGIGVRKRM